MSGDVPTGWRATTLGEMAEISGGSTPSKAEPGFWEGGTKPWVTPSDVTRLTVGNFVLDGRVANFVTAKAVSETSLRMLPVGSVLMTSRATIGFPAINSVPMATNQGFANFLPSPDFSPEFLVQWLIHNRPTLEKMAGGSTFLEISKKSLRALRINLPPLAEQRRIAEMLSSVDEAIQSTQAVIEQTGKVRLRLLHELFHRGQWAEGKPLPEGWKIMLLDEVAKRGSGHTPSKSYPEYWNGGVKWVSLQDTKRLDDVIISETTAEISDLGIANSSAVLHPAGTVVISRDATVGRSAILASPMAVSQHFIVWICSPKLNNLFLYYWLQHMKPVFERIGAGSTIKTIGLPFFKSLAIPLPPLELQVSLGARMMETDQAIRANKAELQRLLVLKASLMADLLTGRRRLSNEFLLAAE